MCMCRREVAKALAQRLLVQQQRGGSAFGAAPRMPAAAQACAGCGVVAQGLQCCGQCKCVRYCGRECQAAHWKREHKRTCGGGRNKQAAGGGGSREGGGSK